MEPVGLMGRPPDFVGTLSGLMGLKQQQQALQGGAADVQMKQQDARQRAALAKVDWNKWMGEDGTLSTDKMIADKDTLSSLGDLAPQVIQQGIQIKAGHLANKENLLKLTDEQRQTWASIAGGLKNDPDVKAGNEAGKQKIKDSFTQFAQSYGLDAAKAVAPFALPVMNDKVPADKLSSMLEHVQMQTLDTQRQLDLTKSSPTFVQGQNGLQGIETNQYAEGGVGAPVGPKIEQGLSPTQQPAYVRATAAAGAEGGQGASNDEQYYNTIVTGASKATQIKSLTSDIQRMASEVQTGQYSKAFAAKWTAAAQSFGLPAGATDSATKRQLLSKMAAQLRIQAEGGASTDAERAGIESAMPNPDEMTPEAIAKAARYVGAQSDVSLERAKLANKHRAVSGGKSTGLREVDSQFMQHADPRIFEYQNIPAGPDRTKYLLEHFTTKSQIDDFLKSQGELKKYEALQ
jgi:hypothetical protein